MRASVEVREARRETKERRKTKKISGKQTMSDEIKFQLFDGRNYNIWKKRILIYLKWKKCDEVATKLRLVTDNEATWNEQNLKAMNYIYSGITNDQLEFVSEEETAYGIMKKLDDIYLRESTAIQICARNKLEKIKLKEYEDSNTFFTDFEKLINELKGVGATITEREKLNYMLRTLPDSLSYIGDLIDAVKESDQTCEFLKNKITMWEVRERGESYQNRTSAFKSERKHIEKTCFGCGKQGHLKVNCKNAWPRGGSGKDNANGTNWQGGAHQSRQQRGGSTGGRGSRWTTPRGCGWQRRGEGDRRHDANYGSMDMFCTEVLEGNKTGQVEVNISENNRIDWILDSGSHNK